MIHISLTAALLRSTSHRMDVATLHDLSVGWESDADPATGGSIARGRADGQTQEAEPVWQAPLRTSR